MWEDLNNQQWEHVRVRQPVNRSSRPKRLALSYVDSSDPDLKAGRLGSLDTFFQWQLSETTMERVKFAERSLTVKAALFTSAWGRCLKAVSLQK